MSKRREVLKGMALGGAAGAVAWKEPVVKGVVVPTHAQTSGCVGFMCEGVTQAPAGIELLFLGGTVVGEGGSIECDGFSGSGTVNSDGSFEILDQCNESGPPVVRVSGVIAEGCGSASGTIDGFAFSGVIVSSAEECPDEGI